jgi:PAS domain S-box-containing protein
LIKVLYLDDEPLLLDVCREFIEVPGQIEMDTALSAPEAYLALSRVDFDVIVSDYQMPGLNGIEFLRDVRSKFGHIPFILFTGRGREEVAIEALNTGADFYLQKGGDPSVQYGQLQKAIIHLAKSRATERSLIVSQRKYSDLMEEVKALAIKLDPDMRITYVNPYGIKQLGWGDSLVGTTFVDWLDKARVGQDVRPRHLFMAMFAQRERGETFTHSFRTRQGELRWVAWTCRFIRNMRGTVEEVLLFGTDITEAKRSESDLKRSLSLVKAAFDSSEEGILVTGMDRNPTEYNRRFLEMWNVPESALGRQSRTKLKELVMDQIDCPELFLSFLEEMYVNKLDERHWTIKFNDGRKFGAFTRPVMIGEEVAGRFWSFKDITVQAEREKRATAHANDVLGLLDNNKANMMILDPGTGEIVYANKAACDFYGYECERMMKMRITDINTLEEERLADAMRLAQEEQKNYFIFQHRMACGEVRDVEVFSGPIQFEGRSLLFSLVHDISEMERTKRSVEESELRHNHVLNSLAVGILVTDADGRMIYANRTVQEMLRRRPDEMMGHSIVDLVADDQKETAKRNVASRVKGNKAKADYRFIRGDGSTIWVQVTAVPLFERGAFAGTIASVVDISEQMKDAQIIMESEKKFREIFNNMHDAVLIHEPGGPFLEVNEIACKRLGYSREELLKMGPQDLDSPESIPDLPEKMRNLMQRGSDIFESTHITKDGRRIPTEINAIMIDYDGKPTILVVCRDITERKIADERLGMANEKLKILNSITRHDIMNQLMVLKGNLELAKSLANDRGMEVRMEKVERSAEIINSQLMFAKDYQEMGTATPQWQNVGQLISQLPDIREVSRLALEPRLNHLEVYADPMLGKVFHNILEDSLRYADKPTRIKIGCRKRKGSLTIVYEDMGPGIPIEEKDRIFDMGFGKGTGLGLHLSLEILSITDIGITENGEPGKGVRFEIEVPPGKFRLKDPVGMKTNHH